MMEATRKQRWLNIGLVVVVLSVLGIVAWAYFSRCDAFDCPNVTMFVESFGPWAPLVYAVLYIASSPIPFVSVVLSAAGGLLFGTIRGALYSIFIATLSSLVPFTIARQLGRDWVESKLQGKRLGQVYQQSGGSEGFLFILLMRLIPILPWEIQNYVAGLSKVSLPTFISATILGITPATTALTFLGESIRDPTSWQFYVAIGINAVAMLIPTIAVYVRRRRRRRSKKEAGQ